MHFHVTVAISGTWALCWEASELSDFKTVEVNMLTSHASLMQVSPGMPHAYAKVHLG